MADALGRIMLVQTRVGGTILHRDVIQREISKGPRSARFSPTGTESLGPQPLWRKTRRSTADEIFALNNAFALNRGPPREFMQETRRGSNLYRV
jgi:hypothetical protein